MSEPDLPRFRPGDRVVATIDLFNDGSFPEAETDALLVTLGTGGEVVQVGLHMESATNVYMVEFATSHVIGCLEDEIATPAILDPTS